MRGRPLLGYCAALAAALLHVFSARCSDASADAVQVHPHPPPLAAGTKLLSGDWRPGPPHVPDIPAADISYHSRQMLLPTAPDRVSDLHRAWQQVGAGRAGLPSLLELTLEWGLLAAVSAAAVLDGVVWRSRQVLRGGRS